MKQDMWVATFVTLPSSNQCQDGWTTVINSKKLQKIKSASKECGYILFVDCSLRQGHKPFTDIFSLKGNITEAKLMAEKIVGYRRPKPMFTRQRILKLAHK